MRKIYKGECREKVQHKKATAKALARGNECGGRIR